MSAEFLEAGPSIKKPPVVPDSHFSWELGKQWSGGGVPPPSPFPD